MPQKFTCWLWGAEGEAGSAVGTSPNPLAPLFLWFFVAGSPRGGREKESERSEVIHSHAGMRRSRQRARGEPWEDNQEGQVCPGHVAAPWPYGPLPSPARGTQGRTDEPRCVRLAFGITQGHGWSGPGHVPTPTPCGYGEGETGGQLGSPLPAQPQASCGAGEKPRFSPFPTLIFFKEKKKSSREQEVTRCCGVLGRAEPSAWTSPSQGKQLGQETPQKPVPMIPPWIVPPARQARPPAPTQSLTSHFPLLKTRMGGRSRRAAFLL